MSNGGKSYYLTKNKKKNEVIFLDIDKMDGYQVMPKVVEKGGIKVNKIVFVDQKCSEKIIRKKIDKKIDYLLKQIRKIDEEDSDSGEEIIRKSLIEAEKLRMMIINKYTKYLGNSYQGLTLKKIMIIIEQLRYKMYVLEEEKREREYYSFKEGRGR